MPIVVRSPWPGSTIVSGGEGEELAVDRLDDRVEVAALEGGVARSAREEGVAAEEDRVPLEQEAHRTRGVAGGVHRVQPQPADVDHRLVLDHLVVGREHPGVLGGDADRVAGVAELRHRLDVVPVAVRLDHPAHAEALAQLEEELVLVGGVEQHGVAGLGAAEDEDVVVDRSHHHLVDLDPGGIPDQRVSHADERMRRLWTIDSLDRRILAISVPALGSLLVEPIYVLTDTAVVGRLGTAPLGGLALASTVLNTLVWVFNFLSYGTTVRVAVRRGRGDLAGGAADALQALWLALGIGLAVAVVIGLTASSLIELLGDDPAVVDQGITYLQVSVVGIPFQMVAFACIGYLYGLPDTKRPFFVLLFATTTNLLLELLLVFGLDWGIAGSAWGTVTAQVLSALVFLSIVIPRLRADGLHRLSVVPSVMWQVAQGRRPHGAAHRLPARDAGHGHRGGRAGRHAGAGRPPDRRADLPAARHHRRHVQGVGPVARRPRARRAPARRGARRRRPPLRLGVAGRHRPDGR